MCYIPQAKLDSEPKWYKQKYEEQNIFFINLCRRPKQRKTDKTFYPPRTTREWVLIILIEINH